MQNFFETIVNAINMVFEALLNFSMRITGNRQVLGVIVYFILCFGIGFAFGFVLGLIIYGVTILVDWILSKLSRNK